MKPQILNIQQDPQVILMKVFNGPYLERYFCKLYFLSFVNFREGKAAPSLCTDSNNAFQNLLDITMGITTFTQSGKKIQWSTRCLQSWPLVSGLCATSRQLNNLRPRLMQHFKVCLLVLHGRSKGARASDNDEFSMCVRHLSRAWR